MGMYLLNIIAKRTIGNFQAIHTNPFPTNRFYGARESRKKFREFYSLTEINDGEISDDDVGRISSNSFENVDKDYETVASHGSQAYCQSKDPVELRGFHRQTCILLCRVRNRSEIHRFFTNVFFQTVKYNSIKSKEAAKKINIYNDIMLMISLIEIVERKLLSLSFFKEYQLKLNDSRLFQSI